MPTKSPFGLPGQESGETVKAPEQINAQAAPKNPNTLARLANKYAGRVGLCVAAALAAGCGNSNQPNTTASPLNVANAATAPQSSVSTDTDKAPEEKNKPNYFEYGKVCETLGLVDGKNKARENYRRKFIQMVVAGEPVLYEPCAESKLPGEYGKFVDAECKNEEGHRTCVVKDSYVDNNYDTVNTETTVRWLLNGYHRVESPQTVGEFFSPYKVYAREGQNMVVVDPNAPLVSGQRVPVSKVAAAVRPAAPTVKKQFTAKTDCCDDLKGRVDEHEGRLDNLEAEVAKQAGKDAEHDRALEEQRAQIFRVFANMPSNPHPTSADWDNAAENAATR